jgi:hypothetical protein
LVFWASKKQQFVVLSSIENEYMALAKAIDEVVWLKRLLHELGFS